jgi:hypothetical protein
MTCSPPCPRKSRRYTVSIKHTADPSSAPNLPSASEPLPVPKDSPSPAPTQSEVVPAPVHSKEHNRTFLTFVAFSGDVGKTAATLGADEADIEALSVQFGWREKLAKLERVRHDKGPEAMAIELNRTVNYVQAVELRQILDRVVTFLATAGSDDLIQLLYIPTKTGRVFSTRALGDLVKGVETAQRLTYLALGDIPGKRDLESAQSGASGSLAILRMLEAGSQGLKSAAEAPLKPRGKGGRPPKKKAQV